MIELKESGIAWIGKIPSSWSIGRIGQLYTERKTKVSDVDYLPLSVTMKGILPQLSTAAKSDAHDDRKLVKKGDFAINSRSDRRGSCGISPYDGSVSLINTILTPREEMHPVYYDWLFHSTMFSDEFYKWGHGIVDDLWTTGWQDMKKISVPMPPYLEQQRIADFLDKECARIDSVIEQTRQSIEEYKKLKQSIITEAVTKGIRPNRQMKDSGIEWIGDMPEEWTRRKVRNVATFFNGDRGPNYPSGDDMVDKGVMFVTTNNIHDIELNCESSICKFITKERYDLLGGAKISINDIIFCLRGSVGACSINKTITEGTVASSLCTIRAFDIEPDLLNYVLVSSIVKLQTAVYMNGTCAANLSAENVSNYYITVPPIQEQQEIVDYLDKKCNEIDRIIKAKQKIIDEMQSYRKSLIYEFVTGKKEVSV